MTDCPETDYSIISSGQSFVNDKSHFLLVCKKPPALTVQAAFCFCQTRRNLQRLQAQRTQEGEARRRKLALHLSPPLLAPRSQIHDDKRARIDATLLLHYGQAAAQDQPTTDQQQASDRSQQRQVRDGCVGRIASSDWQGSRQLFDRPEV